MCKSVLKSIKIVCLVMLLVILSGINVNAEDDVSEENTEKVAEEITVEDDIEVVMAADVEGVEEDALTIERKNSTEYKVVLSKTVIPQGTQAVKIPIWSKINGQDDIVWYDAQKQNDGTYTTTLKLINHKGLGDYYIHAYAIMSDGQYVFLDCTSIIVENPQISNIKAENYNIDNGTFRVVLSDVTNGDMIKKVLVPIWSKDNGQDDIIWYEATKSSSGEYYVDVNIKNHKYSVGTYYVHVYLVDITNQEYFVGSVQQDVTVENGEMTITKTNSTEYVVELSGVKLPGGVTQVQFPTWSKVNGQDDIIWYVATKVSDGVYRCNISVKNHKGLGIFSVHAYAKMLNGSLLYVGEAGFETEAPTVEKIEAAITDKSEGKFQVKISGIENSELIKTIQVPTWSASNQNDIIWYTATKNADGDYIVNANIANHKYNCSEYKIHVYMTDISGCQQLVGSTNCDMSLEYDSLTAVDIDETESVYKVTLSGLEVPTGVKSVQFATWGNENGQNDIKWYTAVKEFDGVYTDNVKIANHKELGEYYVHVYCTTKGNSVQFVGATNFEVTKKPMIAQTQVTNVDGTKGSFVVTVSGVTASSGIEKVQIPIWCSSNQSDIVWYTAIKTSEGTYTVNVNVSNHAHHFGTYKIHVYITMGNGIQTFSDSTSTTITALNYIYNVSISSTQREVGIMGATATRVQFPTWSDTNGQDDIIWYEGVNQGNGQWNAVVNSGNHNSGGTYTTHVYVTSNGLMSAVGSTTYSLSKVPTEQSKMQARANLYGSSTSYIILVNRSTHKVGVFQGWQGNWNCIQFWDCADGAPSTPTVEGTFRVGSKGYYFDSGASRCYWYTQFYGNYLFHSVLYNKNGTLQDGRVGMALSHGCVRLQIQNAKWIYDTIPTGTTVVVYH